LRGAIDESGSAMLNCNAAWPRFDLGQFVRRFCELIYSRELLEGDWMKPPTVMPR